MHKTLASMNSGIRVQDALGPSQQLPVAAALQRISADLKDGDGLEALKILRQMVRLAPNLAPARYMLGVAQLRQREFENAILNLRKAVGSEPGNADYQYTLAEALMCAKRPEAGEHFRKTIELDPGRQSAFENLTAVLVQQKRYDEALEISEEGLRRFPDHPGILGNRSLALFWIGRYEDALACALKQTELCPNLVQSWCNVASVLFATRRIDEAKHCLHRALALSPEFAPAQYQLSLNLLVSGCYQEGFRLYERRMSVYPESFRQFSQPRWDGSALEGRCILIPDEQGHGDIIQFVRYIPMIRARGGEVILEARESLVRFLGWMPETVRLIRSGAPLPAFDVHCPLLSLPFVFATDRDSIPPPAQFVVPEQMQRKWAAELGDEPGPKIGVVWAGNPSHMNDRNRSIPLQTFRRLFDLPNARFFSLQVGGAPGVLDGLEGKVRDLAPLLTDYAETAAAISQLDLVISADTSVAHLAGTLGKPVWLLLPYSPDWRWLLDRDDSPWYPAMRIFRQAKLADWAGVMDSVTAALLAGATGAPGRIARAL